MNIFYTNSKPLRAVDWLDDKRVNKMVIEASQILCGALTITREVQGGTRKSPPYSIGKGHMKHPCVVWTAQSRANYQWVLDWLNALSASWLDRRAVYTNQEHKSYATCYGYCRDHIKELPNLPMTDPVVCINVPEITALDLPTTHKYRLYMIYKYRYMDKRETVITQGDLNRIPNALFSKDIERWLTKTFGKPKNPMPTRKTILEQTDLL